MQHTPDRARLSQGVTTEAQEAVGSVQAGEPMTVACLRHLVVILSMLCILCAHQACWLGFALLSQQEQRAGRPQTHACCSNGMHLHAQHREDTRLRARAGAKSAKGVMKSLYDTGFVHCTALRLQFLELDNTSRKPCRGQIDFD